MHDVINGGIAPEASVGKKSVVVTGDQKSVDIWSDDSWINTTRDDLQQQWTFVAGQDPQFQ